MTSRQGVDRILSQVAREIIDRQPKDLCQPLQEFSRQCFADYAAEDFSNREVSDIYGSLVGSWSFVREHDPEVAKVRVFNPEFLKHGWQSSHTVVAILTRNMPFITDSVRGELNRRNITIYRLHSTILSVIRDEHYQLKELLPARSVMKAPDKCQHCDEALLYLEIGRCTDAEQLKDIADTLTEILSEVVQVVDDFKPMVKLAETAMAEIDLLPERKQVDKTELKAFLQWLLEGNFAFLGAETLVVEYQNGEPKVTDVKGAKLGLLKSRESLGHNDLYNVIKSADKKTLLIDEPIIFSKSSRRSRVHRLVYPDYILVRSFDEQGRIVKMVSFLGLYTSSVYTLSPTLIPIIRGKVSHVLDRSGLDLQSHHGKDLIRVLEVFPRDELFQSTPDELFSTAISVNDIQERRQVKLFVRRDSRKKFVNCLVYTPRDIYHTELRVKIENLLSAAFGAMESEFTTYFSDSILTRTHFVFRVNPDKIVDVDIKLLQEEIINVTMSWQDHLKMYLVEEFGEEQGTAINENFSNAFSPGYRDDFLPRTAIEDIKKIATLGNGDDIAMSFYRKGDRADNALSFRLYHLGTPLTLSDVMPILENLGLRVESEHPYAVKCKDGKYIWIDEFSLTFKSTFDIDFNKVGEAFQEAFLHIWNGSAESDAFNKLIIGVELDWREVAMLRAYARYMKQIKLGFSGDYIAETLAAHKGITASIVELFYASFDCKDIEDEKREEKIDQIEQSIIESLDGVENLSEDRVIRYYLAVIKATLRTNYFQRDSQGEFKNYFSFKLSPKQIPEVPLPVPLFEIFVYSPQVEGVHLRGGKVARGGLRWSDRQEDFRTEVLGLVKAQQVKNSVIVPMGAKGGFVLKHPPTEREELQAEGIRCYKIFIQALLDITDNLVDGQVIPPHSVVRRDEDDIYLVVAADKGTATFSDIANELSLNAGFWLGDAFASGGSVGYDHKKMGITAKGAWVSVQRHFRELGLNIQDTDFTVVGIGDMAGDVFGNGMLLSEHIQLVCAFNHMHIFIDPNPDSASSYVERKRLFELPRSSWEDYNTELISSGGGIFKRSAKSITISPEMKKRFDIRVNTMAPTELINAVLKAPIDLLWNGGIGTYVKSSAESHADAGDKANDILRVDGKDLRCKVIGEGGNLGITQLGRIEFSLHGGRSNTDFIDNAAGVDCSDHEVNIKILLNGLVAANDMTEKQRNQLLESMTDNISDLVLEHNYRQTQAISLAEREALLRSGEYRRLLQSMEASGKLNRELEFLPDEELLQERRANDKGLTRPELSVLISYVKSQLKEELAESSIPDDDYLSKAVESAFPVSLCENYNSLVHAHRLRREIIATQLANDMVNHMGITFVERISRSTGVSSEEVVKAYVTARDVFDMPALWHQIEGLDYTVSSELQMQLMAELIRLVRRAARWFIRNRRGSLDPATEVSNFKIIVLELHQGLADIFSGKLKEARYQNCQGYIKQGVPEELATSIASVRELYPFLSIVEAAQSMQQPTAKVAELYFCLSERLELDWFAQQISALKIESYWQAMARETYRDDLEWQLRTLTEGAMRHMCEEGDVEACVDRWVEQQQLMVDRWKSMLVDLHAARVHDFAMYSVAIRELLDMAQSSKYGDLV